MIHEALCLCLSYFNFDNSNVTFVNMDHARKECMIGLSGECVGSEMLILFDKREDIT